MADSSISARNSAHAGLSRRQLLSSMSAALAAVAVTGNAASSQAAVSTPTDYSKARLKHLAARLVACHKLMGTGNFNLTDFDSVRGVAARTAHGAFDAREEAEYEAIFGMDARDIGFFGERVVRALSFAMPLKDLAPVRGTPHRIYPAAAELFGRAKAVVGERLIVTSGARGVPKQLLLFIEHAIRDGSMSQRQHSVAPPGYSYHSVGDIDVGDVKLGGDNFNANFERSDTYKQLAALDFIRFRYPRGNSLGVTYEPWHIQVV